MSEPDYDVFLSYHRPDGEAVKQIATRLQQAGLRYWLDISCLVPGDDWQPAAEEALGKCGACAVFFGPSGTGPWHHEEMRRALDHQVQDGSGHYRVIPVVLPGVTLERTTIPGFLQRRTRVDFTSLDDEDALHRLVCGIRGVSPELGPGAADFQGQCPYPGLQPFTEEQAQFFFGREVQVQWLLDKLKKGMQTETGARFLAIVGASGSGKSSLALAGLIPALRDAQAAGSGAWPVVVTRPGSRPLENLAIALARAPALCSAAGDALALSDQLAQDRRRLHFTIAQALHEGPRSQRAVILVDQFEEAFTQCEDESQRRALVDNLLCAATIPGGKAIVVLTMRADFYSHCAAYSNLAAAVADHQDLVPPLGEPQLREVIVRPAQLCGSEVENALVHALVEEMAGQTGALPLLQHALRELWHGQSRGRLTYEAYHALGGLRGALERRAEEIYSELPANQQRLCQRLFVRLTQLGRGTEDTKRRVAADELLAIGEDPQAVEQVLQRLAECRLVTMSGQGAAEAQRTVEVAHEALIRSWGRLRQWIDARRASLILLEQLRNDTGRWQESGRDASFLYHGLLLEQGEALAQDPEIDLGQREQEFLDASVARLVEQLANAETARTAELSAELQPYIARARQYLKQVCQQHAVDSRQRLHAALALLPTDPGQLPFLRERLLGAPLEQLLIIVPTLDEHSEQLVSELWEEVGREASGQDRRLRAALVLAAYDPPVDAAGEARWLAQASAIAPWLIDAVVMNPSYYTLLLDALRPVARLLLEPLAGVFRTEGDDRRRDWATSFLADYAADDPQFLGTVILDANARQFAVLLERLRGKEDLATIPATAELAKKMDTLETEDDKETLAKRQVNAAALLLQLQQEEAAWPAFRHSPDPRARSYLIHRAAKLNVAPQVLIARLRREKDVSAKRALLLALGEFDCQHFPEQARQQLVPPLAKLYREHPDPGLHGAAEWLLRQWGGGQLLAEMRQSLRETEQQLRARAAGDARRWYLTGQDHTVVVIDGGAFVMGSLDSDPYRQSDEKAHQKRIDRRFAIAAAAVTRGQYRVFQEESRHAQMDLVNNEQIVAVVRTDDSPITGVTWFEAAAYCNWLSEKEGISQDQWCYEANREGKYGPGMRPKKGYLSLTGYRLPSEAEWEYACRAGAATRRFYGHSDVLLAQYAWYIENAESHTWPVGMLKPNDLGLFDMHGNVWTWCHDSYRGYVQEEDVEDGKEAGPGESRVLRGGSFFNFARSVRAACRDYDQPGSRRVDYGLRPARTYY